METRYRVRIVLAILGFIAGPLLFALTQHTLEGAASYVAIIGIVELCGGIVALALLASGIEWAFKKLSNKGAG